jgi:pimeloyl-ACP methyl ester carboxylesterase
VSSSRGSAPDPPPETVDPIWLLKAIALTLVAALICAWLTACLLVYQGTWQLVLHPTRTIDQTPASAGLAYTDIRFDASETGQPRLTGWWIPASSREQTQAAFQPKYAALTILYLHDGSGSLSETIPQLARLHTAGLNVFAIDYRGFGASDASMHPSAIHMAEDAAAALDYLTSTRHTPARNTIPYGAGLGASLAADLARTHPDLPAVILENPDPDPAVTAVAAHPSRIVPVRLLFGDQFDIARPIATLATPKLLIAWPASSTAGQNLAEIQSLFRHAASPSYAVTLSPRHAEDEYQAALRRFLDQYLAAR